MDTKCALLRISEVLSRRTPLKHSLPASSRWSAHLPGFLSAQNCPRIAGILRGCEAITEFLRRASTLRMVHRAARWTTEDRRRFRGETGCKVEIPCGEENSRKLGSCSFPQRSGKRLTRLPLSLLKKIAYRNSLHRCYEEKSFLRPNTRNR